MTQKAADVLARTLRDGDAGCGQGFRVVPSGPGQLALTLDEAREGDAVITHGEQTVLLVQQWIADLLDGAVLDVQEQAGGTTLRLCAGGSAAPGY